MPIKVQDAFLKFETGPRFFEAMKGKLKEGLLYSKEEVVKMIGYKHHDTRFYKMFKGVPKEERSKWIVKIGSDFFFGTEETIKKFHERKRTFYKGK